MVKELEYLKKQILDEEYLEEIHQLVKNEIKINSTNSDLVFNVSTKCFLLGMIIGKQLERAKHKK